ncbi:histidine phosphatase family protein [Nocardioides sp.]|uniref:histidine phosphatase family protein n=1 Tax=Nocardioides sp. TaxID=35761 RepID=UPI003D145490
MSDLQCAATLIIARHGAAEYESDRWSDAGGSLTSTGREQSRRLGESLAASGVAAVWTSTRSRAVQTAEIAASGLGRAVTTREGLREFDCGDFAGSPMSQDPFATTYARWLSGELDVRIPGAENGHEVVERMRASCAEIADLHRGETVLVVSHGGIVRLALPVLARLGTVVPAPLANTASVELRIDADDWVVTRWG